jgi:hypothetical protein
VQAKRSKDINGSRNKMVEFRKSPPKPPISERTDKEVVEALCIALRDVGVFNGRLPDGEDVREKIKTAQDIYKEIVKRDINIRRRIKKLARETKWPMVRLLEETIKFPETIPYLEEKPKLVCRECMENTYARNAVLGLCDDCLEKGIELIEKDSPDIRVLTCSTCGKKERQYYVYDGKADRSYCLECLKSEKKRRENESKTD